ncbi:MAG: calcium-binding protein, partial [Pseudomonadota bacterium]
LYGENSVDWLYGGPGQDFLDGGNSPDVLMGGPGDDTYIVDTACDVIVEQSNEGIDTVLSGTTYTLPWNVENLILTGNRSVNGTGNGLNNILTGNGSNNDLDGGSGDDLLAGGPGRDRLSGSAGADVLIGGVHDDTLMGGSGSDAYVFSIGSGKDRIDENQWDWADTDVVQFTDVASDGLTGIRRRGNDLELTYGSDDKITVENQFRYEWAGYGIEQIVFSDGTTWDRATIAAQAGVSTGCGWGHGWGNAWGGWGGGCDSGHWQCGQSQAPAPSRNLALIYNQVDLLVSAMAGFAPEASGWSVIQDDYRNTVVPLTVTWNTH